MTEPGTPAPRRPRRIESTYALTPAQQGMLYHTLIAPGSGAYVAQMHCTLEGPLDANALRTAWDAVLAHHPALRAGFSWEKRATPIQAVVSSASMPWTALDWRDVPHGEHARRLSAFLADDRARGFDLRRPPLMRAALVRYADDRYELVWTAHHILLDGWSTAIVLRDLRAAYGAIASGAQPALVPTRPFRQFVDWLARRLTDATESYWSRALADFPGAAELSLPQPTVRADVRAADAYADVARELSAESTNAIRAAAARMRVSENTVVFGGFCATLARYTDRDRFSVGLTVSGRPPALDGVENIVGLFIATVPIVVNGIADGSTEEWLQSLQRRVLDAQQHGGIESSRLREVAGIAGGERLFDCLFAYENYPDAPALDATADLAGVRVGPLRGVDRPDYPLTLVVAPGDRLRLTAIVDTRRFERAHIERLLEHIERMLSAVAGGSSRRLDEVELLSAADRARLEEWAGESRRYPRDASLFALFERTARRQPAARAVVDGDASYDFESLLDRATRVHAALCARGVQPGDRVALLLERGVDFVAAMLGVLRAGAAYVPIASGTPDARLAFMLRDTAARLVVMADDNDSHPTANGICEFVSMSTLLAPAANAPADVPEPARVDGSAIAYVIYTSGSTGEPRGIAIPQRAVSRLILETNFLTLPTAPSVGFASNVAFDASTLELWSALLLGGTLAVIDQDTLLDARALAGALAARPVDLLWLTSGLFSEIARVVPTAFATVGMLIVGGDVVDPVTVRAVRAAGGPVRMLNGYGPTENTTFTTTFDMARLAEDATAVPLGTPITNTSVRILDRHLRQVPIGVTGELYAGGDGLAVGYIGRPEITAERFVSNAWSDQAGARLYRTGDLARFTSDGTLEFLGRADDQVKIRGFRIEPGEIESALAAIGGVEHTLVVAEGERASERRLVAYVAGSALPSAATMRGALAAALPSYMVPAAIVPMAEFPLTPNGKVDRRALPSPSAVHHERASMAGLGNARPTPHILAAIWCSLLGVDSVATDADFFALGGHSLIAMQLASRVRDAFGIALPLRAIFDMPVLRDLAEFIDRLRAAGRPAVPPFRVEQRPREIPLSFAQQRLWFLDRFAPLSAAYHVPHAITLHGPIDANALELSLSDVVGRHEALRTVFAEEEGRASQIVRPAAPVALERVDLSARLPAERRSALAALIDRQFGARFDLSTGPLVRCALIRVGPDEHVLTITLHHIVADGWSIGIFTRELGACYEARLHGREPALPALAVQYADFAVWQRGWLAGETRDAAIAFWQGALDAASVTELPSDKPRPAMQSFRGGTLEVELPRDVAELASEIARARDCTPFIVLLAAYLAFLSRSTGRNDLVVGVPIAGRTHHELEPLIGFFVNMVPIRVNVNADDAFDVLLARVRSAVLDAFDHQDVPFETIVDAVNPVRDPTRQPLVQLTFAVHDFESQELELPGVRVGEVRTDLRWVRFDAEFHLWHAGGGLRGYWAYATDLFERATIEAHHARFVRLLTSALREPGRAVDALDLLDPVDEHMLIDAWNATTASYPASRTLHALVDERVAACGAAPAILDHDGAVVTYDELGARADALARLLVARGVRPGDVVAIVLDRTPALVVAMLATLRAGAAYAPIDPDQPAERARHMLKVASPTVVITDDLRAALIADERRVAIVDTAGIAADAYDASAFALPEVDPACGAYVIFTSGSTGVPKAVLVPHRAIVNHMTWMQKRFPLEPSDRVLQKTAVTFDASIWEFWAPLLAGASLVLAAPGRHADPRYLAATLEQFRITVVQLVPSVAELLTRTPELERCTTLRRVFLGGEALDWPLVERLHRVLDAEVINLYGPAEVTVDSTYAVWPRDGARAHRPIGLPIDNVRAFVLDRALRPVPLGTPGELHLAGDSLAREYLGAPAQTAERFIPNPFAREPGERMYRTGDIVRRLPDGQLEYVGRLDQQVKIRGQRTELGEVEAAIRQIPGVREAIVAPSDADADSLVAWVTLEDDAELPVADDARVEQWHELYEEVYRADTDAGLDPRCDFRGWNDSATGAPIPIPEMRHWLDTTLARILELRPRHVLEIGAGSGLILFGVAPHVERYVATDFAAAAIRRLRALADSMHVPNVTFAVAGAAESPTAVDQRVPVDTVILNSVVQYFPSAAYLTATIERAAASVAHRGAIFIGDVRALPLLDAQLADIELARADGAESADALRRRVRQRRRAEEELVLDPRFFIALRRRIPRIARASVRLKRGCDRNELTRFRYDVVLYLDDAPAGAAGPERVIQWRDLDDLARVLEQDQPAAVRLPRVPNARTARELALVDALDDASFERVDDIRAHVASLAPSGVEPEDLWRAGERLGYDVTVEWSEDPAYLDVRMIRRGAMHPDARIVDPLPDALALPPSHALAHDPGRARRVRGAPAAIRAALESRVPRYMVPAAILALDAMPLTPNGKVDRRALPAPDPERADAAEEFEPPAGEIELALAALWRDVLEIKRVGARDDFFEVGGNSLSAVVLAAAIRDTLGVDLPIARLFEATSIREQARAVALARGATTESPAAIVLGDRGARPIFCFPPLAGSGLAFKMLADAMSGHALHAFDFPVGHPTPVRALADAVCATQPADDLVFLGYSAGGPLALEVAKAVAARGRHVSDLVMIDAAVVDRRARLSDDELDAVIADNLAYFEHVILGDATLRARFGGTSGRAAMSANMRAYARFLDELEHHGTVGAAVHLVRAGAHDPSADDARQPWQLHTTGPVREYRGAGPHVDMLTAHAADNARVVASILDAIADGARRGVSSAAD